MDIKFDVDISKDEYKILLQNIKRVCNRLSYNYEINNKSNMDNRLKLEVILKRTKYTALLNIDTYAIVHEIKNLKYDNNT